MPLLEDVSIELAVVLGATQLPIRQILKMSRGAMIPLDCGHDDPTLVYVNETLVAAGKILVSGDQMSIEITEVMKKDRN